MKKRILVLSVAALSIFGGSNIYAQKNGDPATKVENRIKKMDEKLDLTPDQETKMRELFTKKMQNKQAQKEQHKAFRNEMKSILTDAQWKKMQEMHQERAGNKSRHQHHKPAEK